MNQTQEKRIRMTLKYSARCTECLLRMTEGLRVYWNGRTKEHSEPSEFWHDACDEQRTKRLGLPRRTDGLAPANPMVIDDSIGQPKFTRRDLNRKKKPELRALCKEHKIGTGHWQWNAPKSKLISGLLGEIKDFDIWGDKNLQPVITIDDVRKLVEKAFEGLEIKPEDIEAIAKPLIEKHVKLPRIIQIKTLKNKKVDLGIQHESFETLLTLVGAGVHPYLVGPAGSGKTTAASAVAKALDLPFYSESVCIQTPASKLVGYMDANGNYVGTPFRRAYEKGGVFLLDEIDNGNANVLAMLNSALSNGSCSFADGMVKRHKDFRCIAAANTFGNGADRQYVGRCQLDAATLDRFCTLVWDYDEEMEIAIAGNREWTEYVQACRKGAADLKIRIVISPRASIEGARLLEAGMLRSEVETLRIWKGLEKGSIDKIKSRIVDVSR